MAKFNCSTSNCTGSVTFTLTLDSNDLLKLNITRTKLDKRLGDFYKPGYSDNVKVALLEVLEKLK